MSDNPEQTPGSGGTPLTPIPSNTDDAEAAAHKARMDELFGDLPEDETPEEILADRNQLREKLANMKSSLDLSQQENASLAKNLNSLKKEAEGALTQIKQLFEDQKTAVVEEFIRDISPAVVNFERELASVPADQRVPDSKFDKYLQGTEKTLGKLTAVFNKFGTKADGSKSEAPDPEKNNDAAAAPDVVAPEAQPDCVPEGSSGTEETTEEVRADRDKLLQMMIDVGAGLSRLQQENRRLEKLLGGQKEEGVTLLARTTKQLEDQKVFALEKVLKDILPVVDNLERGLAAIPAADRTSDPKFEKLAQGIEKTLVQMGSVFNKYGLKAIDPKGEEFDHNRHEAIGTDDGPDVEPDTVILVAQKGYELNNRLLRPARVVVKA